MSQDGKVKPHPSLVNSFVGAFPFRWLVWNQKVEICKRQFLHKFVNLSFTLVIMTS